MTKKYLFIGMAAMLGASLSFFACESATGGAGAAGSPGAIYLSGSQTTAGIQAAIDSGAPLVFAGVVQSDTGTVIIPAGRGVKLVGAEAYTTESSAAGVLVVADASSVTGDGSLVQDSSGVVVAPAGVAVTGTAVRIQDGSEVIAPDTVFAVKGPVTISGEATSKTNIINTGLSTNTLYVIGDVEVSAAISTAPTINVAGDVTVKTAAQSEAVVWNITGDLDAQKLPTTGAGTLKVGGNAVFAEAVAGITGTVDIGGNAEFKVTLATGAGAVTVGGNLDITGAASLGGDLTADGTASFKSTLTNSAAAVATFNGATTVTGVLSTGAGGLTIAGKGAVTVTEALGTNTAVGLTVKSIGGVTLSKETTIAANVKATKITVKGTEAAGTLIKSDGTPLTVGAGNSVEVTASGASIVAGGDTNNVTITGATLKPGVYTGTSGKLSLSTTAVIEVENSGSIAIAGSGELELTAATSKVVLKAGGAVDVKAATGKFGESTTSDTKVTVGASATPETATKADITNSGTTWTVAATTGSGTGETNVILGTLKLALTGTSQIEAQAGADPDGGAAGKLVAGTGTTITFIGTS